MIDVLLFAHLKDEAGESRLQLELGPVKVAALIDLLVKQYGLRSVDQVMVAINEVYAEADALVQPGDTVALIPPVSGG